MLTKELAEAVCYDKLMGTDVKKSSDEMFKLLTIAGIDTTDDKVMEKVQETIENFNPELTKKTRPRHGAIKSKRSL
jgi:hypothetical protein